MVFSDLSNEFSLILQSAKLPFLLYCETTQGDEYPVIFKYGDDLRQDQLILQMITLMDRVRFHMRDCSIRSEWVFRFYARKISI